MLGLCIVAAAALGHGEVAVRTDAATLKIGAQMRVEALYNNHGLEKAPGKTVHATTNLDVQNANLVLDGKLPGDNDVALGVDIRHPVAEPMMYGYITHWFSPSIGLSAGKMRVLQGGWDHASYDDYTAHATGIYARNLVYEANVPMAALTFKTLGTVTMQILNDKIVGKNPDATWNATEHPTWVFGWQGEFGPITPLIDVGSYDNNKSRWVDAGLKTVMNGLLGTLDLYSKNQVARRTNGAGTVVRTADVSTGMTLNVAYEIKGTATPWFYFSSFDAKQAVDDTLGLENHEYNTTKDANGKVTHDIWDDNGQVIGFGVNINLLGAGWTPYAVLVTRTGKFEDQKRPGEPEDKSDMWVRIGLLGAI